MHYFGLMLSILLIAVTTYSSLGRMIERQKDNLLSIDRQLVELRRSELCGQQVVRCGFGLTSQKGADVDFSSHGCQAVDTTASQAHRLAVAIQYESWRCPTNALVNSQARLESMRDDELRQISVAMIRQLSFAVALVTCGLVCALLTFLNRTSFKLALAS